MPPCIVFLLFLCCSVQCPKQRAGVPPQAPQPAPLLSNIQSVTAANSRLIVALYPQTAATSGQNPAHLSIFDGSLFGAPNRQTDHGSAKPDSARLAWAYRKRRQTWFHPVWNIVLLGFDFFSRNYNLSVIPKSRMQFVKIASKRTIFGRTLKIRKSPFASRSSKRLSYAATH